MYITNQPTNGITLTTERKLSDCVLIQHSICEEIYDAVDVVVWLDLIGIAQ